MNQTKPIKRYLIILSGTVQGVGCRYFVYRLAHEYGLTGSVKNLDNGNVEIQAQGDPTILDHFVNHVIQGDRSIRVDNYSCRNIETKPETKFVYGN